MPHTVDFRGGEPSGWFAWYGQRGGKIRSSRWRARLDLFLHPWRYGERT